MVVVPTLYLVSDAQADAVRAAAEGGAHVLVTYFSGISDPDDHVRLGGYPGAFRELLGIRVEEFFPLRVEESVALSDGGAGSQWSEHARVVDAEVVTTYAAGPLAGRPAVTRRTAGDGVAWYVGTLPDDDSLGALLARVVTEAGVAPAAVPPAGRRGRPSPVERAAAGCSCSTTPTSTARSRRRGTTWSRASTWARPCGSAPRTAAVLREG